MRGGKRISGFFGFFLAVISFMSLLFFTCPAQAAPITLKFVSFVPLGNKIEYQSFKRGFIDVVNEKANGELVIKVMGGPETIPPFELGTAVQKGIVDMAILPTAFFESLVPGVDSAKLSFYTGPEERTNGVYEYISKMYNKAGLHYLGREATNVGFFYLFSKKKIESKDDFKGMKLGGSTAFHGFYNILGASVVTMPPSEYHTAMERGVVDGVVTSLYLSLQLGLPEVAEYLVLPGFYRSTVVFPVNLKKWNELPKNLQDLMTQIMIEYEKTYIDFEEAEKAKAIKKIEAAGTKVITLAPDVAAWFSNAAREGSWQYAEKRFPESSIPDFRKMITEK